MRADETGQARIAELVALNLGAVPAGSAGIPRRQHPKHHGCVDGVFQVRGDLPEHLRHGVFAEPRSYRALVRFSNGRAEDDRQRDAHGMAIKLLEVPGEKLIEGRRHEAAQDFVLVDHETFFTGDPDDYARVNRATMGKRVRRLCAWAALLVRPALLLRIRSFISKRPRSPLESAYFSTVPYRLGDMVVKYAVTPREPARAGPVRGEHGLALALRDGLAASPATFDFCVDIQSDADTQPIEDPTRSWSQAGAERVVLAELILPAQRVDARAPIAENLQFSPWHALPVHAPLGYINRARAPIYREMAKVRHARAGVVPIESSEAPASYAAAASAAGPTAAEGAA